MSDPQPDPRPPAPLGPIDGPAAPTRSRLEWRTMPDGRRERVRVIDLTPAEAERLRRRLGGK